MESPGDGISEVEPPGDGISRAAGFPAAVGGGGQPADTGRAGCHLRWLPPPSAWLKLQSRLRAVVSGESGGESEEPVRG